MDRGKTLKNELSIYFKKNGSIFKQRRNMRCGCLSYSKQQKTFIHQAFLDLSTGYFSRGINVFIRGTNVEQNNLKELKTTNQQTSEPTPQRIRMKDRTKNRTEVKKNGIIYKWYLGYRDREWPKAIYCKTILSLSISSSVFAVFFRLLFFILVSLYSDQTISLHVAYSLFTFKWHNNQIVGVIL